MKKKLVLSLMVLGLCSAMVFGCGSASDEEGASEDLQVEEVIVPQITETEEASETEGAASESESDSTEAAGTANQQETEAATDTAGQTEATEASESSAQDSGNASTGSFEGMHTSSYDGSTLTITNNGDGTYKVDIELFRLCSLENGVGTLEGDQMTFVVDDPNGEKLTGAITRDSNNVFTVTITESSWPLLANGDSFIDFQ